MRLIYGSQAIKFWFKDFYREPKDIDFISNENNHQESTRKVQYYWTEAFKLLEESPYRAEYVYPDDLYTIKVSHAAWDINWEKTMKDIEFLRNKGCELNKELYTALYSDWEKLHGKKKVNMAVYNSDFFKDNIYRKYDHEGLHEIFKFYNRPLNEAIREDLNSPLCSEDLWDKLSQKDKIKCALEEIFVLSTERYIEINKPYPVKTARIKTLKQMITSTTSGFFNLFLIENFTELRTSKEDYFKTKLKELKE